MTENLAIGLVGAAVLAMLTAAFGLWTASGGVIALLVLVIAGSIAWFHP
jgi:uncharacterized membrane protein YeaQ/YmgE (transglycosylase-associated protein family)